MADSPRWCATHKSYGDHHTDRCPLTWDERPPTTQELIAQQYFLMGKPAPSFREPTYFPLGTVLGGLGLLVALTMGAWFWAVVALAGAVFFGYFELIKR